MSEGSAPNPAELAELREAIARVQHEVNNPLAALLAEVQLLSIEPQLSDEHRAVTRRMEDLVRRVIAAVRMLDQLRGEATI